MGNRTHERQSIVVITQTHLSLGDNLMFLPLTPGMSLFCKDAKISSLTAM